VLGTPVPRVLDWCGRAQGSSVGAEYVVMEKVIGVELEGVWPGMGIRDRFAIVKAIAGFQKEWCSISFKRFGSLYYADDLNGTDVNEPLYVDADGNDVYNGRFAVGPSTGRETIDEGRANIDFDHGPCNIPTPSKLLPLTPQREHSTRIPHRNRPPRSRLRPPSSKPTQIPHNPLRSRNLPPNTSQKAKSSYLLSQADQTPPPNLPRNLIRTPLAQRPPPRKHLRRPQQPHHHRKPHRLAVHRDIAPLLPRPATVYHRLRRAFCLWFRPTATTPKFRRTRGKR
jgi:hypothetical protein